MWQAALLPVCFATVRYACIKPTTHPFGKKTVPVREGMTDRRFVAISFCRQAERAFRRLSFVIVCERRMKDGPVRQ
ncbi:MAG: hypothetical protein PUK16_09270 [Prevotellaceae bacterium]|nr:hypothetical protein [Prevotella sp.]MDD7531110.1 hypothetical protein [Prevotellaceae bacterium]MDY2634361.1 hypothetical protein [Prevotella sp.]